MLPVTGRRAARSGTSASSASVTQPKGNATTGNPTDYNRTFTYTPTPGDSTTGLVKTITDPLANVTANNWNANGTLASQTLPANGDGITRTTTYNGYDPNGLATQVTDPAGGVAEAPTLPTATCSCERDPNHASVSAQAEQVATKVEYDAFGRERCSSAPKSTAVTPGLLVWEDQAMTRTTTISSSQSAYGRGDGTKAPLTSSYDAMDRDTLHGAAHGRGRRADVSTKTEYDAAGRVIKITQAEGRQLRAVRGLKLRRRTS